MTTQNSPMNDEELQEKTWDLLLEVASEAERFGLSSDKVTPHHTRLLQLIKSRDQQIASVAKKDENLLWNQKAQRIKSKTIMAVSFLDRNGDLDSTNTYFSRHGIATLKQAQERE